MHSRLCGSQEGSRKDLGNQVTDCVVTSYDTVTVGVLPVDATSGSLASSFLVFL